MAINDILRELGNGVNGSLFTNDLAIYIITRHQRVAIIILQTTTNKTDAYATQSYLSFSPNKTVTMTVTMTFSKKEKKEKRDQLRLH